MAAYQSALLSAMAAHTHTFPTSLSGEWFGGTVFLFTYFSQKPNKLTYLLQKLYKTLIVHLSSFIQSTTSGKPKEVIGWIQEFRFCYWELQNNFVFFFIEEILLHISTLKTSMYIWDILKSSLFCRFKPLSDS